jgi:hypothetical protein
MALAVVKRIGLMRSLFLHIVVKDLVCWINYHLNLYHNSTPSMRHYTFNFIFSFDLSSTQACVRCLHGSYMTWVVLWLRLALSRWYSRVGVFFPSSENRNRSSLRNVVFSSYLQFKTKDKAYKTSESKCYKPLAENFRSWQVFGIEQME